MANERIEEALRLTEERFRLLVESVRDYAIYLIDPNGIVVTWNIGAERIKGYKAEEIVGQSFAKFYTPEDRASGSSSASWRPRGARGATRRTGGASARTARGSGRTWSSRRFAAAAERSSASRR